LIQIQFVFRLKETVRDGNGGMFPPFRKMGLIRFFPNGERQGKIATVKNVCRLINGDKFN
jgi:hypothetical protein